MLGRWSEKKILRIMTFLVGCSKNTCAVFELNNGKINLMLQIHFMCRLFALTIFALQNRNFCWRLQDLITRFISVDNFEE